ncbi:hypothetical protein FRC01_005500 [Tulasnella sp. 417]|nr:hypothetical protein FRC01_005500 [Tulasnella sp. 417]
MLNQGNALPTPAFQSPNSLQPEDFVKSALNRVKTEQNFKSSCPKFRQQALMVAADIIDFILLPGGRYALTIEGAGEVSIVDLRTSPPGQQQRVGRSLARYRLPGEALSSNFQLCGADERTLILCAVSETSGGLVIDVLQLTFIDNPGGIEASSPHLIYRTPPIFDLYVPAVELRDNSAAGLAAIMVEDNFDHLFMVFVDYRRGMTLEVNTGLRPSEPYDMYLHNGDCIIFGDRETQTIFHAYFDVATLMSETTGRINLSPHCTRTIDTGSISSFEASVPDTPDPAWHPVRPWNTPAPRTGGLVPLLATSAEVPPNPGNEEQRPRVPPRLIAHWVDPDDVSNFLRAGHLDIFQGHHRTCLSWPDQRSLSSHRGETLFVPTRNARNMLWVHEAAEGSGRAKLSLIPLPPVGQHASAEAVRRGSRDLELPSEVDLKHVAFVKFCDETGLLVVGMQPTPIDPSTEDGATLQSIHLFWY